jgi:predicted phage tail protein
MMRDVYLEGELGDKFGHKFTMDTVNFRDTMRCIECNVDGLKKYLIDCGENNIDFSCEVVDSKFLEETEADLLMPLGEGDLIISPVPAGAKSGGSKILAAVAIAVLTYYTFGAGGWLGATWGAGTTGGISAAAAGNIALMGYALAINLAITGIQQVMAPDPATDNSRETYLFNGSEQNIVEGDPVPVLYGELRVPGQPISFEILNNEFRKLN